MSIPGFRDAVYLVSKGVPYETAMRMKPARRLAHVIAMGEADGDQRYNWSTRQWETMKR